VKPPYVLAADLTAYCLRHSYASDRIADGISKEIVSLLMGHGDVIITDVYIDLTPEMFADALKKINEKKTKKSAAETASEVWESVGTPTV